MAHAKAIFDQLNIVSSDPAASIEFYRRLGVSISDEAIWRTATGIHHAHASDAANGRAELEFDSVAFARIWNPGWRTIPDLRGRVAIGFRLPSRSAVDDLYADMTGAGYVGLHAPHDAFWGSRYAILEDPDGLAVGLMSPRSADKRTKPPEI